MSRSVTRWLGVCAALCAMTGGVVQAGDASVEALQEAVATASPDHAKVLDVSVEGSVVTVAFSRDVLEELSEGTLTGLFQVVDGVLGDSPDVTGIRLTCEGRLLSSYLPRPMAVRPTAPTQQASESAGATTSLTGRKITIAPSHGRYWTGSAWAWQRSDPCGFGEDVLEDTNSIRLCQFLQQYLTQDGATVHVPRQMEENDCCHGPTGLPWWKMAARYWLEHQGLPAAIWDALADDYDDDIRARPLYADHVGSDIFISQHTNAGGDGTATGTETYYDSNMDFPAHIAASQSLATAVQDNVISAIQTAYDATWTSHGVGVKDSNGSYGEIRVPDRPACLIELAYHDNCTRDAEYLRDNYFRSVAEWGLYAGVCDYFGTTPTWDKYSCESVNDTIPTEMTEGESYSVSITLRNRGVLWDDAHGFELGAVNESDPFDPGGRVAIGAEVGPGEEHTFGFVLTAPGEPGVYQTQWQMVRDDSTWFGPIVTKTIIVYSATPTVGWIEDWAVLGPFTGNNLNDAIAGPCSYTERNMDPSAGNLTKGKTWTVTGTIPIGDAMGLDLSGLSAAADQNAYAHAYIFSPSTRTARARVGANDTFEVFLDGTEIIRSDTPGSGAMDEFVSGSFTLTGGWHRLMAHVARNTGAWKFMIRFDDGSSEILDDLDASPYRSAMGKHNGLIVPSDVAARPPVMRDWLVLGTPAQGPFSIVGTTTFSTHCTARDPMAAAGGGSEGLARPYAGLNQAGKTWHDVRDNSLLDLPSGAAMINFNNYYTSGNDRKSVYAHTYCYNPGSPKLARISIGFDDGGHIYVNGTRQYRVCGCCGGCDTHISPVFTLNQGDNSILFRVDEEYVLWYGVARLIEATGTNPLAGVILKPDPSPPDVIQNPISQVASYLQTIVLNVVATGINATYQWQKNGVNINDGAQRPEGTTAVGFSGTKSATLTITNADASAGGQYRCVITNVSGSTESQEANVTVALKANTWQSVRTHDANGSKGVGPVDLAIDLPADGTPASEPRVGGVRKIVVQFSENVRMAGGAAVTTSDVAVTDSQSTPYTPAGVAISDNRLEITFSDGQIPDQERLTLGLVGAFEGVTSGLSLAGDADRELRTVVGDTNGDGAANLIDVGQIKSYYGETATAATTRVDVNVDGVINLIDLAASKSMYGHAAP